MESVRSRSRWLLLPGVAAAAVLAAATLLTSQPDSSRAATGPQAYGAPGDVFELGGCTGWAITPSLIATADHCPMGAGLDVVSVSGKHVTTTGRTDVPGSGITVLRTDGTDLAPFRVASADPAGQATVYGFGHSGGVLRQAVIGPAVVTGGDRVVWRINPGGTVCHGDSGAPVVQGDAVVAVLQDGDDKADGCAAAETGTMAAAPALAWLRENGLA